MIIPIIPESGYIEPHPCPYRIEIGGVSEDDEDHYCQCDDWKTQQCAWDI